MGKPLELVGQVFGRLTVIARAGTTKDKGKASLWLCDCSCGTQGVVIRGAMLRIGKTKSCGCLQKESRIKHGQSGTKIYDIWVAMKQRCSNPSHADYSNYGGRGITVCEQWATSLDAFKHDMGPRPSDLHSLDRIDNNGNYEPGNCRWATPAEQIRNRRNSVFVEYQGQEMNLADAARLANLTNGRASKLNRQGKSLDTPRMRRPRRLAPHEKELLKEMVRRGVHYKEIMEKLNVSATTVNKARREN